MLMIPGGIRNASLGVKTLCPSGYPPESLACVRLGV